MKIYKLIPRLEKQRMLRLWHQAQEDQWSARAIPWDAPLFIQKDVSRDRMARILTPVLMSEQSAFNSAAALLPILGERGQDEAQYYMTTWIVDEARHAELFLRMIDRFEREPLSPRKQPAAYYFQAKVRSNEVVEFLAGLLVSEVMAKKAMTEFLRLDLDTALSQICERILNDEARHLGFNRIFTEDHIASIHAVDPAEAKACVEGLESRLEFVLEGLVEFLSTMKPDFVDIGFDMDRVIGEIHEECRSRMHRAITAGLRPREKSALAADLETAAAQR